MSSLVNSTKQKRKRFTQIFPKNWKWGNIPQLFYEANITPISKPSQITKKGYWLIFLMNLDVKILKNMLQKIESNSI